MRSLAAMPFPDFGMPDLYAPGQVFSFFAAAFAYHTLSKGADMVAGRTATTSKRTFDRVADQTSGVDWQRIARWVQDRSDFTSSGVSAGMDMALAVIEDCLGSRSAQDAATYAEYIRNPDPDTDPFAVTGDIT